MAERKREASPFLVVERGQHLTSIPLAFEGREVTCYFVEEEPTEVPAAPSAVRAALRDAGAWDEATESGARPERDQITRDALAMIGAWDDLDWDEMVTALDRIRHESKPTPPIEL